MSLPSYFKVKVVLIPLNSCDTSSKTMLFEYVSSLEFTGDLLMKVLPWKLELVVIPVQSLEFGSAVAVVLNGVLPYGAEAKLMLLPTIL